MNRVQRQDNALAMPALVAGVGLAVAMAAPAVAEQTVLSMTLNGETIDLTAGSIPGLFAEGGSVISPADLGEIQDSLNAAGIETRGHLSIMLAETEQGLSLINLFDGVDGTAPGTPPTSVLGCQLVWEGIDTTMVNLDAGGTWVVSPGGGDLLVGVGAFQWQADISYEAMSMTDLSIGQSLYLQFNDLGLHDMSDEVLQLITFSGAAGWQVEQTVGFTDDVIAIDATVTVIIPAPAALAVLAAAGIRGRRRRRA
ncbi:MAG: hypothetical protein QF733_00995 [Phycisphaerales bacterium]|nr:hypothetical protein [Phycisphaerales bacterium]